MTPSPLPSPLAAEPPEMVLVPRTPTKEMLSKAQKLWHYSQSWETASDCYRAMLEAAPAAPQPPEPVAWRFRFHTDDSLAGKPNVRGWVLTDRPVDVAIDGIEAQPLYTAAELAAAPNSPKEARELMSDRLARINSEPLSAEAGALMTELFEQPSPKEAPEFAKGSWQHAVDDALVPYMKTSQDFATPHDAVKWLLQITADAAALPKEAPQEVRMLDPDSWPSTALDASKAQTLSQWATETEAAKVRLLTEGELEGVLGRFFDPGKATRLQRKFMSVNAGKTIPATSKEQP